MKFIPHEYQKYAIEYIKQNPISAILLDMGLGKTVISLTAINDLMYDSFEVHKVLIIAPLRVARFSWGAEIRKWNHLKKKSPLQHRCRNGKRTQSCIAAESRCLHHQP